jgi:hypothetical protein
MSKQQPNPANDATRLDILEENEELFKEIRDAEGLSPRIRQKYGKRALDYLETLRERDSDE